MTEVFTIEWSKRALRQLRRLPAKDAVMVHGMVSELRYYPDSKNVKKLISHTYGYRLRVGKYRVLFNLIERIRIVSIEEVRRRNENTY